MQHFTRNTVEVSEWCSKCGRNTMHRVDGVKLGPCLDCLKKLNQMTIPGIVALEPQQEELFDLGPRVEGTTEWKG